MFARRVGSGAGNCFSGSNWDCVTLVSTPAGQRVIESSIGVVYDTSIQDYAIHIVYHRYNDSTGQSSLGYARKLGGAAWSTASIGNTAFLTLGPDALAMVGYSPVVAYGESGQGLQVSEFQGPAMGDWDTTTVDSTVSVSYAAMDTSLLTREVAYLSGAPVSLKAARYNWFTGSWSKSTVDTGVENEVSVAFDGSGDPHIGYKKSGLPRRAKQVSGVWSTETADSTSNTGYGLSLQIDTQLAVDKAILVHSNGFGSIRVSTE